MRFHRSFLCFTHLKSSAEQKLVLKYSNWYLSDMSSRSFSSASLSFTWLQEFGILPKLSTEQNTSLEPRGSMSLKLHSKLRESTCRCLGGASHTSLKSSGRTSRTSCHSYSAFGKTKSRIKSTIRPCLIGDFSRSERVAKICRNPYRERRRFL